MLKLLPTLTPRLAALVGALAFGLALPTTSAGEKIKFFEDDNANELPSKSVNQSDLSRPADILERGVRNNAPVSSAPSSPKPMDPAKLQELLHGKLDWLKSSEKATDDSSIRSALGVRDSSIETTERSFSNPWLQNNPPPRIGKFANPFKDNDPNAADFRDSTAIGSLNNNQVIPTFKLGGFGNQSQTRPSDPFSIIGIPSSTSKRQGPAELTTVQKLFGSPSSAPEKDPLSAGAFGLINSQPDATQRPLQPVTGSRLNPNDPLSQNRAFDFSGNQSKFNLGGNSSLLNSIGARTLGDSSLAPAVNITSSRLLITPQPPVLDIPKRKF